MPEGYLLKLLNSSWDEEGGFTGVQRKVIILERKRLFYSISALWFLIFAKICVVESTITYYLLIELFLFCFF